MRGVQKTILIKPCIQIFKDKERLLIKGPLGVLFLSLPVDACLKRTTSGFQFVSLGSCHPLILTYYKLLLQKIKGVEIGFFEILIIQGVGWQVVVSEDNVLKFSIGFSYPIQYSLKSGVEVLVYEKQRFKLFGLDLCSIQQAVSELCSLRLFNIYKGKGIYKEGKVFKLKVNSKSKA